MRVSFLVPYANFSQESGVLFLLANYLQHSPGSEGRELLALKCNGNFSVCDRDGERNWRRGLHSCLSCMRDQSALAAWSGVSPQDISQFISSDDFVAAHRLIARIDIEELIDMRHNQVEVWHLCKESFVNRFGTSQPDLNNKLHQAVLRKFFVGAVRMMNATAKFNTWYMPELSVVAGGHDLITAPFVAQSQAQGRPVSVFKWDLNERCIMISHPHNSRRMRCELVVQGLSEMRSDARTWSSELLNMLDEIVDFLEIPLAEGQLSIA